MANEVSNRGQAKEAGTKRRGRGPAKLFPTWKFEDVLVLPKGIYQHAVDDQLRRLTLFDKLQRSPESSGSRDLVINSARYGLTTGGMAAEYLAITPAARAILDTAASEREVKENSFNLAIQQIDVFAKLYDRLKGKRLPSPDVFRDELLQLDVPEQDRALAADIFTANVRYLGLVREVSGSERLISVEHLLEDLPAAPRRSPSSDLATSRVALDAEHQPRVETQVRSAASVAEPSVHIDIQIHIDSTASPEQIDQIFASMARHLYRREG